MATFQIMRAAGNRPLRSTGRKIYGKNVSVPSTTFPNGCSYRMPWAVSRDLQKAAISNKELYFRVTHAGLKDTGHTGNVQTSFDFEFQTLSGTVLPYVTKSYNGTTGTLFGVLNCSPAGSAAATQGWFYFSNPVWTGDRSDHDRTFPNATVSLFLPSKIDQSGSALDFSVDLPTADKTLVNPGALCNGTTDETSRTVTGTCTDFLYSFLAQDMQANDDATPTCIGNGTGNTLIFMRHCYATPNGVQRPPVDITNCWRAGFSTAEGDSFYESAKDTTDTSLQHMVFRRVSGQSLEMYINGVLVPWDWKSEPGGRPQAGTIDFTGNKFFIGRGSTSNRYWQGYLDCVKFYKNDAKTATWAASEYANLMAIDDAIIFGAPEALGGTSLWGEAIELPCDGAASVSFDASKYSTADVGTVSVDTAVGSLIDPPGGTLTPLTGNNVSYHNSANQAGLDEGSVRLKNTAGAKIIVPARFIISVSITPPSGYYKTPNIAGKTARPASNIANLVSVIGQFASGTYSTATSYIEITGPITGNQNGSKDFTINASGNQTHPLVIMSGSEAGSDTWTNRAGKKIKDVQITVRGNWVWWYGNYFEYIPTSLQCWGTDTSQLGFSIIQAGSHGFFTANRFTNSRGINTNSYNDSPTCNFNWFEMATQSGRLADGTSGAVGAGDDGWRSLGSGAPNIVQNLMFARNRFSQYAASIADHPQGAAGLYFGNGVKGVHNAPGCKIEYNFIKFNYTRGVEFKYAPDFVRWNHFVGLDNAYAAINFRGESAGGGEVSYNRIEDTQNCMVEGKHIYNSNWMIDSGTGAPSGLFNVFSQIFNNDANKKSIAPADGSDFVGNKCNVQLAYDFEPSSHNFGADLGATDDVLFADHLGGTFRNMNGAAVAFSGGVATGNNPHVKNSAIKKQTAIPAGYTVADPPILNTIVCGPNAAGKQYP
jgi:hypothetical protein